MELEAGLSAYCLGCMKGKTEDLGLVLGAWIIHKGAHCSALEGKRERIVEGRAPRHPFLAFPSGLIGKTAACQIQSSLPLQYTIATDRAAEFR